MAIVKHIKSRNANYSAAINYLLFEHDEKTGKKIVDESGRSICTISSRFASPKALHIKATSIAFILTPHIDHCLCSI